MTQQIITIYHNPRCSKSRQTLALIEADIAAKNSGSVIEQITYLDGGLTVPVLAEICQKLGMPPTDIIRKKDAKFIELGLNIDDGRSAEEWCQIICDNPAILERPIVVIGDKAVMGRPPENVLEIL
jgi:arsenate reductase